MVRGISKQVIVVHSPDPKLFEQAIFILRDDAKSVSDEQLLLEAKRLMNTSQGKKRRRVALPCLFWGSCGAVVTSIVWLACLLI